MKSMKEKTASGLLRKLKSRRPRAPRSIESDCSKPLRNPVFRFRGATGSMVPLSHKTMTLIIKLEKGVDIGALKEAPPESADRKMADEIERDLVPFGFAVIRKKGGRTMCELSDMTKAGEFEVAN